MKIDGLTNDEVKSHLQVSKSWNNVSIIGKRIKTMFYAKLRPLCTWILKSTVNENYITFFFSWIINRNIGCIQDGQAKQLVTTETLKRNILWSSVEYGSHRLTTPRPTPSQRVRPLPEFTGLWLVRCPRSGRVITILVVRFRKIDQEALTKEVFGVAHQRCLLLLVQRRKMQKYHNFIYF